MSQRASVIIVLYNISIPHFKLDANTIIDGLELEALLLLNFSFDPQPRQ